MDGSYNSQEGIEGTAVARTTGKVGVLFVLGTALFVG